MSQMTQSVVFIDANISDLHHLINGVLPGISVQVLSGHVNGITQITDYLKAHPASTVHIVSHGAPGSLFLGNTALNLSNLDTYTADLQAWFSASPYASLLLYGCNVAAGDAGAEFVEKLHQLTGAAIGASTTKVGNAEQGGSWHLDAQVGEILPSAAFSPFALATYPGVFVISVTQTNNTTTLLNTLLGDVAGLSNIQLTTSGNAAAFGTFSNAPFSFDSGIVLSTGAVTNVVGPNNVAGAGTNFGTSASGFFDVARITITFDVAAGLIDPKVFFEFIFGSEEFPEYGGGSVNDSFELKLNGTNLAKLSDGQTVSINNLAPSPTGPFHPDYIDNTGGADIQLDAYTETLTLQGALLAGQTNTLEIFIGDVGDGVYDSAVFIRGGSFGTEPPPPIDHPPSLALPTNTASLADGTSAVIAADLTLTDPDGGNLLGAEVSIGPGFKAGQDALGILGQPGTSGTVDGLSWSYNGSGVLTLSGNASAAVYQSALRKVTFLSLSDAPATAGTRTVQFATSGQAGSVAVTVNSVNDPATGAVTITGTPTQGQVLTAANTLADPDGLGPISYQWQESTDGTNWVNISGATSSTFTLGQAQVNKVVRVNASFTDGGGTPEGKASTGTSAVANVNDPTTGSVTISGTPTQGQTLTAANTLADLDGIPGPINYRWQESTDGNNWTNISGATADTFVLTQAQVGKFVRVKASFTDGGGTPEARDSVKTATTVANVNDPATGGVTITGTPTQGQTLTAANTLADVDGIPGPINYQWQESTDGNTWVNISGATASTFTLGQNQVGKFVRANASFTDGGGTLETKASTGTATTVANVNDPATGGVTITGTPTQGQTLTAANTLADVDGIPGPINYQWQESTDGNTWTNITGATGSTFALTQTQVGKFVRVNASFTDGGGTLETKASTGTATTVANVNDPATGGVTITGTPTQGQTLTAANTLADVDGIPGPINYQWQESTDGNTWVNISGATASTFTLGQNQVGKFVRVNASFTDGGGTLETEASTGTATTVANVNDPATGGVTITGTPTQGQTLTAANTLADVDGIPGSINYQWQESTDGNTWTNISGATASTFTLGQNQVGKFVRVNASFTDGGGTLETKASTGTATTVTNVNDTPTGGITIPNSASQGEEIVADASTLADLDGLGTLDYQWQQSVDGINWTSIEGATTNRFTPGQSQVGQFVRVKVSYTDGGGLLETVNSNTTTNPVVDVNEPPTGAATIDGAVKQGQTLTANTSTLGDDDGLGTLSYQWQQSADGNRWTDIENATNPTLALRNDQVGQFVRYTVSYVDGKGTAESLTSAATTGTVEKFEATSDFNGDGSVDLFWQHRDAGQLAFWFMDNVNLQGGEIYQFEDVLWQVEAVGDLNGDKKPDLIFQHTITNESIAWIMDGTNIIADSLLPEVGPEWDIVETGDFNNDGQDEILWRHATSGELAVWYMKSNGLEIASGSILNTPEFTDVNWDVVAVADFNNNGNMDILWWNEISGEIVYWNMEGENYIGGALMDTYADTTWTIQGAADFNQDGNMDLLWENIEAGQNVVWFMNGLAFNGGTALTPVEVDWVSIV